MKISADQVRAALKAYVTGRQKEGFPSQPSPAAAAPSVAVDQLQQRLDAMPEERAVLVQGLKSQVRRGRYHVASLDIVNALLGRLTADLLGHD